MSLVPNGVDLLSFFSEYPNDKVVHTGSVSIVNDGATTNNPQSSKIVTSSTTNPYGKKCMVRFKYSVDGTNYNSQDAHLAYAYTITTVAPHPFPGFSTTLGGLRGAVSIGVSASEIKFRTANGYHGNVTDNGTTYAYTPTSQTFTIVYALYEAD